MSHGGIRLPPNVVKILYKWGLKDALKAISVECRSFEMDKCGFLWHGFSGSYRGPTDDTGEVLGMHVWDEDIFTETGGAFLLCHVSF